MPQIWDNAVIDDIELVEGKPLPIASVKMEHLHESTATVPTYCHWKGIAIIRSQLMDTLMSGAAYRTPYTVSCDNRPYCLLEWC